MFLHKIWFWKLGGWRNYHATKEKWHQILNLSDFWLEVLSMQLAVLEFNFSWDTLNGCNCCFIRQILPGDHPLSTNAKFLKKTNISNPLIRKRTCAYQGVRNVSFSEIFAFVLNELPPMEIRAVKLSPKHAVSNSWSKFWLIYFEWL